MVCLVSAEEASPQQLGLGRHTCLGQLNSGSSYHKLMSSLERWGWRACEAVTNNSALLRAVIVGACPGL